MLEQQKRDKANREQAALGNAESELRKAIKEISDASTKKDTLKAAITRLQVAIEAADKAGVKQQVLRERGVASLQRGLATQELDAEIKKTKKKNTGPRQLDRLKKALEDAANANVGGALWDGGKQLLDYERKQQEDEKAKKEADQKASRQQAAAESKSDPVPDAASSPKEKYTIQYAGSGDTEVHALSKPEHDRLQEFIRKVNEGMHPQTACHQVAQGNTCKPCAPRNCMLGSLYNAYYAL